MFGHKSEPSKIYSYGARTPAENAERVDQQMLSAHRYRNALVEKERERRARVDRALCETRPELAAIEAGIAKAHAAADAAGESIRKASAAERRKVRPPAAVSSLKEARAALKELRARRKALRTETFASDAWKEAQGAIDVWAGAEQRRLRSECGLYWGNYLSVEQTVSRSGPPPRFHRWDGEGRLAVQLQGGLSIAEAFSCGDPRLRIEPVPEKAWRPGGRRFRRTRVWFRVGSDPKDDRSPVWAVVPIVLHRMPPADSTIKWAYLIRRRIATHFHWRLQLVLSRSAGWAREDCAASGTVGIDVGWRLMGDGALRVAYWVGHDGREGQLALPARWLSEMRKTEDIRSIRDKNFDAVKRTLSGWLAGRPPVPDWLAESTGTLGQWRSEARLAALAIRWRSSRFDGDREIFDAVEAWRKRDKHLYEYECYDDKTEVLTRGGWHLFNDLTKEDELATVNLDSDMIQYQKPTAFIAKPYKGPMVAVGGNARSRVDLMVTPNHRMVVYPGQNQNSRPTFREAGQLTVWDRIKTRAKWNGDGNVSFRCKATGSTHPMPETSVAATDMAALLGWYVAEGCCVKTKRRAWANTYGLKIRIYQDGSSKRPRIRELVSRLPWTCLESARGFEFCNKQLYSVVESLGGAKDKYVPQWIKDADTDVIRAFVSAAVDGDGWRTRGGHETFSTVSKRLADDMQELYLKLGYGSSMSVRSPNQTVLSNGKKISGRYPIYYVSPSVRRWASLRDSHRKPNFRLVDYDGMVYCATVPNGALIVRRNGKVAICGNCNVRDQLLRRREDVYRNFAADTRRRYRSAHLEDLDLRDFHELPAADQAPADGALREHTRDACLSFLVRCLKESMSELEKFPAKDTTRACHNCGSIEDWDRKILVHTCSKCGTACDQDRNAAINLLRAPSAAVPQGT